MNTTKIGVSQEGTPFLLNLKYLNRHAYIGGSTGSGKTTTVKTIIDTLQSNNINTLVFDAKGDLSVIANHYHTNLYDYYNEKGLHIQMSLSDLSALELGNMLELTQAQQDTFSICLLYARNNGYIIDNYNDLNNTLLTIVDILNNDVSALSHYGYVSKTSVQTLMRKIKVSELNGDHIVFDYSDYTPIQAIDNQSTIINSQRLVQSPKVYATIVSSTLNTLYNQLEEVGDIEKPRLAIFIDEAHLLFNNAPKQSIKDITQIIKLIRSKGVSIFFISQLSTDVPQDIFSQLSLKIQHHINIATRSDYQDLKALAFAFGDYDKLKETEQQIKDLAIGQAITIQRNSKGIEQGIYQIVLPHTTTTKELNQSILEQIEKHKTLKSSVSHTNAPTINETKEKVYVDKEKVSFNTGDIKAILWIITIIAVIGSFLFIRV